MIPRGDWEWFGHPAHFICGDRCRFHLATLVGQWLVSTVGEFNPGYDSELMQKLYPELKKGEFVDIGFDRKYETMVFKAGTPCEKDGCACGLPEIDGEEQDFDGYNTAGDATTGHMAMCEKWAKQEAV